MSDAQQEPSMEEILASIRKIISEDDEAADGAQIQSDPDDAEPAVAESLDAEEPLELDDALELEEPLELDDEVAPEEFGDAESLEVEEKPPEIEFADFEPEPEPEPEPHLEPEPEPFPAPEPMPVVAAPALPEERIVSEPTAAAGSAAFLALEQSIRMGQAGETLEDVVKGLLRPMLRSWLDENLPDMVERLVRAEIEKMAGGARRRGEDDD
ncbi:MAG: DUF2497 domain-containing protein [Alphaproteobacteria bacterium]|nr:DUF2497 domain-containing protein [Alphaproteobacteria bacterium]